jgi:hypothetical protein
MAFDTSDGRERVLATDTRCKHPMITPSGKRVITDDFTYAFRDQTKGLPQKIYVMDWSGGKRREICSAFKAVGVAEDPPGTEWVMVLTANNGKILRYQIDNPSVQEVVWDKSPAGWFWAFTRDGKHACTGMPWPNVCVVQLPNGPYASVGGGCAEGIAPDGKRAFHFLSDHAGVVMHDAPGAPGRYIDFRKAPGMDGHACHFPAWAHYDARFFTVTGPQAEGKAANVLFGQFDDKFTTVVKWVQVTKSPTGDIGSFAWIAPKGFSDATSLVSGLTVKSLGLFVKRLDQGGPVRPILEELRRLSETAKEPDKADEAKAIIAHVNEWAQGELERAKGLETQAPADAEKAYKNLVARFEGLEPAKAAQQRLQDKPFQEDLKSWAFVERMQAAEKRLKDVPGAGHTATDPKFARANSVNLGQIRTAAQTLAQQGASPWIVDEANAVLQRCGIEPKIEKRATAAPAASAATVASATPPATGPTVTPASVPTVTPPAAAGADAKKTWPTRREGLVFLWETYNKPAVAYEPAGTPFPVFSLTHRGPARIDRNYALLPRGGSFVAERAEDYVLSSCRTNQELTLEVFLTAANVEQDGPASIVAFSDGRGARNFLLGQQKNRLVLVLRTSEGADRTLDLCPLAANEAYHLVVAYKSGSLLCYKNGKEVLNRTDVRGDLKNWGKYHLVLGDEWDGRSKWLGTLEGVALWSRFLDAATAREDHANYMSRISGRKPALRLEVQAKLLARSRTPAYEEIAPYPRTLVVYEYEIETVLAGSTKAKKIRVAHWGMMDHKVLTLSQAEIGKSYRLTLENWADNPQLETERLWDMLPQDPDLPLYYDVGS